MFYQIEIAEKKTAGEGIVTLQTLSHQLYTLAWADLRNSGSVLAKVLTSKYFKDTKLNHEADQISVDMLKMFAILHC